MPRTNTLYLASIPFHPEPIHDMRDRIAGALNHECNGYHDDFITEPSDEVLQRHIFDFFSGVRLFLSMQQLPHHSVVTHVVGSWAYPTAIPGTKKLAIRQVRDTYFKLRGFKEAPIEKPQIAPSGLPHLFFPSTPTPAN